MDDMMLERFLERIAATAAYPATPALRTRPSRRPALAVAAIVMIGLGLIIALAVPNSRSAIAEFSGVEGSKVERLPTPAPGVTPTPLPIPADPASLATPVSLEEASRRVEFQPARPRGKGEPTAVFVATYGSESVVILRYADFDLWEMRARDVFFGKGVPTGVVLRDTSVAGRPAHWIEGGPHTVRLFDDRGEFPGSERTVARDTLIWRTDFALYRMETTLSDAAAIRVAETLP